MADGYLNFDTKINEKGFNDGVSKISKIATTGLGVAVGNAMTKVAGKVGEIGTAAIKVGMTFEAEMSKVSAISGATGDELSSLTDKAKEMGAKTKFSATESAQAMEYMAMAGWKTTDMLNGIEGIMNLAAASGENLATTSDIVTDALTAFGLSAQDSTHFADVLAAASSNANTNVSMMGETFKYVAPVAGALGFSVEDCGVAIGLMANSGIKAGQAGTSLRQMLSRLTKPTKEVQTAMDTLGLSLTDSEGNVKSLDTVMADLRNGFSGLSKAEQTQIATSLAGQEAMSGLLAIVNASDEDFNKLKNSIYNADGVAAEMAATMQDNLAGQITILKSGLEGLGISIYESVEVPLKNLASVGVKAISDLNEAYASGGFVGFINEIGNKVPMLKSFTDAIAGFAEKTKGMSTDELMNLGKLTGVLVGAVPAFSLIGKSAGTFSDILGGLGDVTGGAITAIGKFPGGLKNAKGAITGFGGSLKNLGSSIVGPFQVLTPKLNSVIGKTFSFLPTKISGYVGKIGPAVAGKFPKITSAFQDFGGYIGAWGGQIGTAFQGVLGKVAGFMPAFANLMGFGAVLGVVAVGLGLLYSQFGTQIDQILLMMQTKGPEVITNFCNGIVAALPNLIAQGGQILNNLMLAITANLPAIIQGGIAIISSLISGIAQQLPTLIPTAVNMILTLATSLLSNIEQIIDAGIDLLVGLAQGLVNALPQLINKAPTIIGQLATAIISNLPKILQAGIKILGMLATGLIQAVPQLISKIPSIISQIKNAFTSINWGEVGSNIIKGIANGLKNAGGAIVEAAKGAAESALNAAKNFLGIHSPSRVFRDQVGKMMALGMGIGFERNIPVKSMSTGVQRAVAGLQKSVDVALSARTSDKTVGGVKSMPGFDNNDIDYDRLEKIQMKAADKMAKRPIYLDKNRIDKPLPKGAVPVW